MIIKKGKNVKNEVLKWAKKMLNFYDEYDSGYYAMEYIVEHPEIISSYYVLIHKGIIKDLIYREKVLGLTLLTPLFIGDCTQTKYTMKAIKKYFKKNGYIYNLKGTYDKDFIQCNKHTSVDLEHTYCSYDDFFVLDESLINCFRDALESFRFPKMTRNISFKIINGEDVSSYLHEEEYSYPMWKNRSGNRAIIGFRYLQPDFVQKNKLLVAEVNGMPIGCIKYGLYGEGRSCHYGLNYIDVATPYRNNGIATILIKEFAKVLPKDYPLVLSDESEMGRHYGMKAKFKKEIPNCFSYNEWLEFLYTPQK